MFANSDRRHLSIYALSVAAFVGACDKSKPTTLQEAPSEAVQGTPSFEVESKNDLTRDNLPTIEPHPPMYTPGPISEKLWPILDEIVAYDASVKPIYTYGDIPAHILAKINELPKDEITCQDITGYYRARPNLTQSILPGDLLFRLVSSEKWCSFILETCDKLDRRDTEGNLEDFRDLVAFSKATGNLIYQHGLFSPEFSPEEVRTMADRFSKYYDPSNVTTLTRLGGDLIQYAVHLGDRRALDYALEFVSNHLNSNIEELSHQDNLSFQHSLFTMRSWKRNSTANPAHKTDNSKIDALLAQVMDSPNVPQYIKAKISEDD